MLQGAEMDGGRVVSGLSEQGTGSSEGGRGGQAAGAEAVSFLALL